MITFEPLSDISHVSAMTSLLLHFSCASLLFSLLAYVVGRRFRFPPSKAVALMGLGLICLEAFIGSTQITRWILGFDCVPTITETSVAILQAFLLWIALLTVIPRDDDPIVSAWFPPVYLMRGLMSSAADERGKRKKMDA